MALQTGTAPARQLIAATVDHGLRPASADEARRVGDFCAARGIEHHVLRWQGEKPSSGIQEQARLARYRLLSEVAGRVGAVAVATAHTLDDQLETVAMRAARAKEASRGLAGMAPATLFQRRTWVVRPFLALGREGLRRWLAEQGLTWIEDPSNADTRFERVRIRVGGAAADAAAIAAHQQARRQHAEHLAAIIAKGARLQGGAVISFDLSTAGGDDCRDAIGTLMALAGGRPHLPGQRINEALAVFVAGSGADRMNAARAVVERRRDRLYIHRERRGLPTLRLRLGERAIYDGRYEISTSAAATVAPAGAEMIAEAAARAEFAGVPPSVVRRALSAEPAVTSNGRTWLAILEQGGHVSTTRHLALFDVFLPLFDLTLANGSAALFSRAAYPPLPLGE
jgi:tRNA(Ile)-lysidine synthase